jgi:hypothetical protein
MAADDSPWEPPEEPSLGIAECLVNAGRVIALHGIARVDDKASVSEELAYIVTLKAFALEVSFAPPGSILRRPGEGQVGLI